MAILVLLLSNDIHLNPGPDALNQNNVEMLGDQNCPLKRAKGVKMVHLNIRSVLKNIEELRLFALDSKPDIITLSETGLDGSISNSEVNINGYNLERNDRNREIELEL